MGKPEGVIEDYLIKQAKANGFLCEKFISGRNGVPDRILIGYKKVVFVETKAPTKKTRELQNAIIDTLRKHGAKVYVIDTKDKVDELLQELLPKRKTYKK